MYLVTVLAAVTLGAAVDQRFWSPPTDPDTDAAGYDVAAAVYRVDNGRHEDRPSAPIFLIIAGTDDRPGLSGARNDALHVVGVNPALSRGTILNIPRDTYTGIPGHGRQKITAAHQLGGPQLLADTIASFTGVRAQYVLTTNFAGFVGLVDAAGGVRIDIPTAINDRASSAIIPAGTHVLTGEVALAYARARKTLPGGDFSRTENQGRLLLAALAQIRSGNGSFADTAAQVATLLTYVRTHGLALEDLFTLARLALTIDPANVANVTMPGTTGSAGGASVVLASPAASALFADFADDAVIGPTG